MERNYREMQHKVLVGYYRRQMLGLLLMILAVFGGVFWSLVAGHVWGFQLSFSAFGLWGISEWWLATRARRRAEDLMLHTMTLADEGEALQLWLDLASSYAAKAAKLLWFMPTFVTIGVFFPGLLCCSVCFGYEGQYVWFGFIAAAVLVGIVGHRARGRMEQSSFKRFLNRIRKNTKDSDGTGGEKEEE
jgi:hypothetical protein